MKTHLFVTFVGICLAGPAAAATLLNETFDDEAANFGTQLDFDDYSSFFQNIGTTDLISSGSQGITCVGGSGGCVDLDGSTAGTPASLLEYFFPGEAGHYSISFDLSGNQRAATQEP